MSGAVALVTLALAGLDSVLHPSDAREVTGASVVVLADRLVCSGADVFESSFAVCCGLWRRRGAILDL